MPFRLVIIAPFTRVHRNTFVLFTKVTTLYSLPNVSTLGFGRGGGSGGASGSLQQNKKKKSK